MAMDPGVTSALIGAGVTAGSTLANGIFSQRAAAYNQEMNEKNMALQYRYAMESQRMAPVNEVYGLRAAGLSPTLANGAQGMSVGSGSQGTVEAPKVDPANLLFMAQLKNIEADTDKKKQETDNLMTVNETNSLALAHAHDLDATLAKNMPVLFDEMAADSRYPEHMRKMFEDAAKSIRESGVTQGGLQGLEKYLNLRVEQKEALVKEMSTRFDWNLAVAQLDDPHLIKALVKMPQDQRRNLVALSGKYIQEVATLAQTAESEKAKREKIGAEIQKLTRETQKILHSDGAQMWKEKDAQGVMWLMGSHLAGSVSTKLTK